MKVESEWRSRMQSKGPGSDRKSLVRRTVLRYSSVLALTAGYVNAVALLIFALPVGNLTATTTQLGMNTANPWLYEEHVLLAVLLGYFLGAVLAGVVLPDTQVVVGARAAIVLCFEASLLLVAAAGAEDTWVRELIASSGLEGPAVQALLAAGALGLQNGLTSSFREMAVRTTHFTGTITDLGLIVGRIRKKGIDGFKATMLGLTLVLFLSGGAAGLLAGARFGGFALFGPALACLAMAASAARRPLLARYRRATRRSPAVKPELAPAGES